ncbi:MAG TPA: helix-turn-helix transcriptional regulator [Thermoanaerobaculia bacterium]
MQVSAAGIVGTALRSARTSRGMSLSEVAAAAGISTATLSRIETEKQGVAVSLLLTLSRILRVSPAGVLGDNGETGDNKDALVSALAALTSKERAKVVAAANTRRVSRGANQQMRAQLDGLLATMDVIREELSELQRQARRRRR